MSVELTETLLSKAAGWDVMKVARAYLAQGQVVSSFYEAPLLRGVVRAGDVSFRASLVIRSGIDMENLCHCREARQWGKICAHSVAVGLHWLAGRHGGDVPGRVRSVASVPPSPPKPAPRIALRRSSDGEPADLFLILPPNLESALARGRVQLVFEAKWRGGRCPLNALPRDRTFRFSERDRAVLDRVEALADGETPAVLQVGCEDLAGLLPALAGHAGITLGKSSAVTVTLEPLRVRLRATLEANGEIVLALADKIGPMVPGGDWVWQGGTLQPLGLPPAARGVGQAPVRLSRAEVPRFLSQDWPGLRAAAVVESNFRVEDFVLEAAPPRFVLELRGGLAQLTALLQCTYGPRILTPGVTGSDDGVWLPDVNESTRYSTRDVAAERAAVERLRRCGFVGPDAQGRLELSGQNAVLNFFAREFPRLEREWAVTLEERLERSTDKNLERIEPRFQVLSSGVQWFDLGVVYATGDGETLSAAEIQRLLLSGQSHTRLKNGKYAVLDTGAVEELQEVLLDCAPEQHAGGYRIQNAQAGFLEATVSGHSGWRLEAPAAWRERAARQSGAAALACPALGDLESVLRPYQKHGVAWLHFLRENGFGGILADEMGLGKTLQTLAFLRTLREAASGAGATGGASVQSHLIVCPTSLVFNWVAEARRFTPELKVLTLHGPDRHARFEEVGRSDVVVTSYALIRRDAERYRQVEFDVMVLDEAQHIKNRETRNAQAVKGVRARQRVVLTGTPLENSVLDLWSIFDFLMPGYLGTAKEFRERYELPITRERSGEVQGRLARRLRPFVLRRLKRDVVADLPAKLEQVAFCELTADQRAVYQQVMEASRRELLESAGATNEGRSRMVALNALLRLRQICCDLRLLRPGEVAPERASGKLELFGELMEEVMDGGHRVLVFSQFVSLLTLLREWLTAEQIDFCYLDGSTTDRAAVVERFQREASIPVFLISLKAGGVGLNLTGADTVIHFDPWWNPAVEDQATDRAHRIGQSRVVTSYKLIARDTVEEKIVALQGRKRELIEATLGGEEDLAAALSWEEIRELLD